MMLHGYHQYLEQHLLSCISEQQLLLPGSATISLPSMNIQTTTINIVAPSSQNSTSSSSVCPVTYPSASNTPITPKRSVPKARDYLQVTKT